MIRSPIFLDTVGLLALWDRSDQWHLSATRAFQEFSKEQASLYTSSLVLLECANAAARRPYRTTVAGIVLALEEPGRTPPTPERAGAEDIGWSQFISEMYGSMADAPLERWPEGFPEERLALE